MSDHELSWDPQKAFANLEKHGVSFEEAAAAIDDNLAVVRADHAHSEYENRFVLVGESGVGRLVTVVFTIRGDAARIISARTSTQAEKRRYVDDKMTIRDAPLEEGEMLDEYGHLDGWERSPFRFRRAETIVSLDPDVSAVFRTSEQVNEALRTLIVEGRLPARSTSR